MKTNWIIGFALGCLLLQAGQVSAIEYEIVKIDPFSGTGGYALDINAAGQIVGYGITAAAFRSDAAEYREGRTPYPTFAAEGIHLRSVDAQRKAARRSRNDPVPLRGVSVSAAACLKVLLIRYLPPDV